MNLITNEKYKKVNVMGVSECGEVFDNNMDFVTGEILEIALLVLMGENITIEAFNRKFELSVKEVKE